MSSLEVRQVGEAEPVVAHGPTTFRIERPAAGIAHLVVDAPGRKLNVLDEQALSSLERALETLEGEGVLQGIVIVSGKPRTFIAGADVHAIAGITDRRRVLEIVQRAHRVFGRLAALDVPTVAAIEGACLGGGAELALACHSRIAADEPHTQIGFPEVQLGILPAFGGTTRLPRLVGTPAALDLLLTGKSLDARRAERIGLVARAVPAAWLIENAHRRIAELAKRPAERRRDRYRPRGLVAWALETPPGRSIAIGQATQATRKRVGDRYPAPYALLRVLKRGLGRPLETGFAAETEEVAELVVGPVCKNLIRLFLLGEQARKEPMADPALTPATVRSLAVIGAGVMGAGIVELAARQGIAVRMRDVTPEALSRGLQTIFGLVRERSRRRRMPRHEMHRQLALVQPTLDPTGLTRADFAIEAVVEDLQIKRRVFAELEVRLRPDAVLATNTSSLSVSALGQGLAHPERFCGFHFFNPVHRMPLVEVVRGKQTSDGALVTGVAFARRLGKTPVVVEDSPGFVVNRVLMPYLREAMHLVEEGYRVTDVDQAMRAFGMPMGPFEVLDEVGLDVALKASGVLTEAFPDRMSPAPALTRLVEAGRLGKKCGAGFYRHLGKRATADTALPSLIGVARERATTNPQGLAERMVLAMVNESARCLEEQVIVEAGLLDLAMVYGAGFPPFRGGPLRHADTIGLQRVESRLIALQAERGERFRPAGLLSKLAAAGETFTQPVSFPNSRPGR